MKGGISLLSIKVSTVTPLSDMRLLVTFENGVAKIFDVRAIAASFPEYAALENPDLFALVQVEPGGYGVAWTPELDASEGELWENGVDIPLSQEDLTRFAAANIVSTGEACEMLSCSRQNIDDLVRRKKLRPVRALPREKLFLRCDIAARRAQGS